MKEISDILNAYIAATRQGQKAALATVVHVEGSSYRRPGARMLVTDDGRLTGAISGGCLEGDALRKALLAISQQENKLVTYDTTDEDDAKFGVQLGCNGIVHILFEPIAADRQPNAISLLKHLLHGRKNAVLVTLFSFVGTVQPGTSLLYRDEVVSTSLDRELEEAILSDTRDIFQTRSSAVKSFEFPGLHLTGFFEFIPPPVSLIIAGAGNDVQPVVELAATLGWRTTIVDGRPTHATTLRFTKAVEVLVVRPEEVLGKIEVDEQTVFLLMTHNYNYDLSLLKELLPQPCRYIGVLGPKKKMDRMFGDLQAEGIVPGDEQRARIYSPVGLDIGAETAEEIAVSIVAEIKAVLSRRRGGLLKEKETPIHNSTEQQ